MGMMFRRNKLRRLEAEQAKPVEAKREEPVSVKDKAPEIKRRSRRPKE